jgi:hypothetical protein
MREYVLSAHARTVIAERGIALEWIERVITQPDATEAAVADPALRHALGRIAEHDNRVLRVIYNDSVRPLRVVTAYFDRTMKDKL